MTEPFPPIVPLVLLAAGLGTRFGGGVKPLAPVGRNGEPLLEVALLQARRAGFRSAVVVTSDQTRAVIEAALARPPLPVRLADQAAVGPVRAKPWGTVAAVLAALPHAGPGGLTVANGDDLYGTPALRVAHDWIAVGGHDAQGADALVVAYDVGATLSPTGGVSRAVVTTGSDGRLRSLSEQRGVHRSADGVRTDTGALLDPRALVSMNLWAFRPRALDLLTAAFAAFVATHGDDATAELGLPDAVGALLGAGGLVVDVVPTASPWHGVTFLGDVPTVRARLAAENGP